MEKYDKVDPEEIIHNLNSIIEKIKAEKRLLENSNEKKLSDTS